MKRLLTIMFICIASTHIVHAQDLKWFKRQISSLCSPSMGGRGYVDKGREKAATHIERAFSSFGLRPILPDSAYQQVYSFPVNTFPQNVLLSVNKKNLIPGAEFLVDAASISARSEKMSVTKVDISKIKDSLQWNAEKEKLFARLDRAYFLTGTDSLQKRMSLRQSQFAATLPKGVFIIPQHGKMTWTVATRTIPATVLYVQDSCYKKRPKKISLDIMSKYESSLKSSNVMGMVRGKLQPDSFVLVTAHYDHLGKMGDLAVFPGASDNASGTTMMMYLAQYFAANPPKYSMIFIAFSGEEAGLKGSKYFNDFPPIAINNIKFVLNLDIMGDATEGITVVNATEHPSEFSRLNLINKQKNYLPEVRSRGKAANSDHYYFTEAGIPAFFIYTNGGKGYYHDIFDTPNNLTLTGIAETAKLLTEFLKGF
jgi:hypothetical protein